MAKSESSRKGRKLKKSTAAAEEQAPMVEPPKEEKRSSSSRRSKRSKRSSASKNSKVIEEVAFMAEGDDAPAADAPADAPADNGAPPVETKKGDDEFKTEFINADKEDEKAIAAKAFQTTSVNARGRIHEFCDDCEVLAALMLTDALKNKGGRERCLRARMALLTRLWTYRDTSDCEDDFPIEEFHKEMRSLATVQRKLRGLDSKISALMLGADDDSDDTDGEGEVQNLANLKQARQNLRYALGEGQGGFS